MVRATKGDTQGGGYWGTVTEARGEPDVNVSLEHFRVKQRRERKSPLSRIGTISGSFQRWE